MQPYLYSKYIYDEYREWPKELRFGLFRKQNEIKIPFKLDGYNEAVSWASRAIKEIESYTEWPPTYDEWFCTMLCDFRGGSCQFSNQGESYDR